MNILILGGTIFVGRALVEDALARGHRVTLFNRGQHSPELFPEVEKLRGSRDGGLQELEGRRWDAVIDTCGYVPRIVRQSTGLLANAVDRYVFISSLSVYSDLGTKEVDEEAALGTMEDETVEEITGETYGPLKVLCERAVEDALPGRTLISRPGLIVGPTDPTDRFTYWPRRVARGREVLAPGHPDQIVQLIDVRDLAEWTIRLVEEGATGVYNATGPEYLLSMQALLETCRDVSSSSATFTWASQTFLLEQGVTPWTELPLWVPLDDDPNARGFTPLLARHRRGMADCSRAIAAGLSFRPLAETVRDTLAWDATRPQDAPMKAGITAARETELLRLWHEQQPA